MAKRYNKRWKSTIKSIARDFYIDDSEAERIINETDHMDLSNMPAYYKNDVSEYKYDICYKKLKSLIMKKLS